MKKICILIALITCFMFPIKTNADILSPIGIQSYANEITVGSTVTYKILGNVYESGQTNLNGTLTYDTTQLEYLDMMVYFPTIIEGQYPPLDFYVVSNKNGVLEYKITNEYGVSDRVDVLITFKVKKVPTTDSLVVKFTPEKDVLYGEEYVEVETPILGRTTVDETNDNQEESTENNDTNSETESTDENSNEVENETNEETEKNEENKENKENKENTSSSDSLFLILLVISMCLNIILIIAMLIKNKKNKQTDVNTTNNENQNSY